MGLFKQSCGKILSQLVLVALCILPFQSHAVILDWDSVNWSSGNLTGSFDIDSSNPGNDITITISGATGYLAQDVNDVTDLTGGYNSPAQQALFMNMNYDSRNSTLIVTVTFNYAQGVQDVSFSLFDVDRSNAGSDSGYTDKIVLLGKNLNNTLVAPTTITTSSDNAKTGTGTNVYVYGTDGASDTSSSGNVGYGFTGTNTINSFTFTYGNENSGSYAAPNNPGNQWISLFDITYTPRPKVPEWHPGLIASFACMMMAGARRVFF
ncbi:MAG TPA: hypothetical protein VGH19_23050 [Verrucomicrobiae bacterium]